MNAKASGIIYLNLTKNGPKYFDFFKVSFMTSEVARPLKMFLNIRRMGVNSYFYQKIHLTWRKSEV